METKKAQLFVKLSEVGENIEKLLNLQKIITLNLGNNKGFITQKSADTFYKLSNYKDKTNGGCTIGIFNDKNCCNLVATASVDFNNLKNTICEGIKPTNYNPKGINCDNIDSINENKALMVHPNYRGCKLGEKLVYLRKGVIRSFFPKNKIMLVTDIAKDNKSSLFSSYKKGFKALNEYVDCFGVDSYLMFAPVSKELSDIINFNELKSMIDFPNKYSRNILNELNNFREASNLLSKKEKTNNCCI